MLGMKLMASGEQLSGQRQVPSFSPFFIVNHTIMRPARTSAMRRGHR